jgi:hypothetical protein
MHEYFLPITFAADIANRYNLNAIASSVERVGVTSFIVPLKFSIKEGYMPGTQLFVDISTIV